MSRMSTKPSDGELISHALMDARVRPAEQRSHRRMRLADLPPCSACNAPPESCACAERKRDEMYRASGLCVCACGRDYYHHPADAEPYEWLTIRCDGTRVKL